MTPALGVSPPLPAPVLGTSSRGAWPPGAVADLVSSPFNLDGPHDCFGQYRMAEMALGQSRSGP